MELIEDKISTEIIAKRNTGKPTVVSICGAADLGKSHLSQEISKSLRKRNLKINHLTLDSYLMDREMRKERGLSGYDLESYNITNALNDLIALKNGESIDFYPYDHTNGQASSKSLKMDSSDVVIFDGLHSMHSSFLPHTDIAFFVYTQDKHLKKIRSEADLIKRNYTIEFSKGISESEFNSYKINVEPYKSKADYLIFLESKWNYKLKITGQKSTASLNPAVSQHK